MTHQHIDLRKLNSLTKKTLHPIPLIKNLIQKLSGHQHYILVDLKDSYQSLRIHKDDRSKAAIVTRDFDKTTQKFLLQFYSSNKITVKKFQMKRSPEVPHYFAKFCKTHPYHTKV